MFENDTKGWYGSYSIAGRESAEKYHIVVHKDEILNIGNKKLKTREIFSPDEIQQIESFEDQLNIFKAYSSEKKNPMSELLTKEKKKIMKMKIIMIIWNIVIKE